MTEVARSDELVVGSQHRTEGYRPVLVREKKLYNECHNQVTRTAPACSSGARRAETSEDLVLRLAA